LGAGCVIILIPLTRFFWDPISVLILLISGFSVFNLVAFRNIAAAQVFPDLEKPYLLIGFAVLMIASAALSIPSLISKQQILFMLSVPALFIAVRQLADPFKRRLSDAVCWTVGITALLYLTASAAGGRISSVERTELFVNDNVIASFIAAGVFFGFDRFKDSKIAAGILILLCTAVLFIAQSALAIFSIGLAFFIIMRKSKPLLAVLTLVPLVIFGAWIFIQNPWLKDSIANRLSWWTNCVKMILHAPWLGFGPGSFEQGVLPFTSPGLKSAFAHNFILQEAAEIGIPALLLLLGMIKKIISKIENPCLLGAVLTLLIHGLADFNLNIPGIFLFLILTSALGSKPWASKPPPLLKMQSRIIFSLIFILSTLMAGLGGLWLVKT